MSPAGPRKVGIDAKDSLRLRLSLSFDRPTFGSYDAFVRDVEDPGKDHRNWEADGENNNQQSAYPRRNTHDFERAIDNLNDDERDTTIEGGHAEDLPSAEFVDEG